MELGRECSVGRKGKRKMEEEGVYKWVGQRRRIAIRAVGLEEMAVGWFRGRGKAGLRKLLLFLVSIY